MDDETLLHNPNPKLATRPNNLSVTKTVARREREQDNIYCGGPNEMRNAFVEH